MPDSATFASTMQATIAGTMHYMSPEQLQGRGADVRSDIFSFGAVLFELLAGRPAFDADNAASLIAAILTTHPRVRAYVPNVPKEVARVIDRAMAKDPDDRWQSARDLKAALELIASPPPVPAPSRSSRAVWALTAVLGVATAALAWSQWGPDLALGPGVALSAPAASNVPQLQWFDRSGRVLGTVGEPADYSNPALSPDGRRLAVSVRDSTDRRDILVFDLVNGGQTRLTDDPADETNPVWSPDGSEILYCSDRLGRRDLYARPPITGEERLVLSSDINKNPMDWARDGSAIYYNIDRKPGGHEIWRLPLKGDDRSPRVFLADSQSRDWVALSPDARSVLYRAGRNPSARVLLRALASPFGERPIGGAGVSEGHWRADGRQIYFIAGGTMMAQDVEVDGPQMRVGKPTPLFRVRPTTFGRNAFVVTPDGSRFLVRTGS
jgi:serine/threonine protein kinase